MPRPPGNKRGAILEGASRAFFERGFSGSTLPQIAKYAGVSAATVYLYFENKEGLANALFTEWKHRLIARTVAGLDLQAPPQAVFMAFWTGLLEFGREQPEAYLVMQDMLHSPYLSAANKTLDERFTGETRRFLGRYRDEKILLPYSTELLEAFVAGAAGQLVRAHAEERLCLDDQTIENTGRMCWAALAAR